ncbi:MAG: hypothetical protein WAK31_21790 [Chthoniobacterales bacterium]
MSGFDLSALEPVFLAVERTDLDLILVGGHAVSFYAAKYRDRCPELAQYFPLRSKDADWIGTIDDGMRLASALHLIWRGNPRKGGMQGLSLGRIDLDEPRGGKIEILGQILGAGAKEIRETAVTESALGFTIRIINPFLLYETKGLNLATIPQREGEGGRQDAKQFAVMGIITSDLLKQFAMTPGDERALIKTCGRLLDFSLSQNGAALVKAGAMDPFKLLPFALMETHAGASVRNLANKRLPHFRRQLDSALEKVPAEQAEKIRADLERMESELARPSRGGEFSQEVERERGKRRSFSDHSMRVEDKKHGPDR